MATLVVCHSYTGLVSVSSISELEKELSNLADLYRAFFINQYEYERRKCELEIWIGRRAPGLEHLRKLQTDRPSTAARIQESTGSTREDQAPSQSISAAPLVQAQRRIENAEQRLNLKLYPSQNWAAKYWLGFPLNSSNTDLTQLQRASARLGSRFNEPHMSLGWCIVTDYLYKMECGSILSEFQAIGAEMRRALELRHCGYQIVGAQREKVAAFYQPFDRQKQRIDEELFLQFNERILNLFRCAAKRLAQKRNSASFRYYLDPEQDRAIEVGEVGGIRVYQMKAVRPSFHVTVGGRGAAEHIHLVEPIKCPPIEFPSNGFYVDAGKRRKI